MQPESMHPDDLIGMVKHQAAWRIFAGTVAEWVLDYASYDPAFDPSRSGAVFRGNLLLVDVGNSARFLEAMTPFALRGLELARFLRTEGPSNWPLSVFVDFDDRLYINGFTEIPIHEYLPPGWKGVEGSPLDFAPETIRHVWLTDPDEPLR